MKLHVIRLLVEETLFEFKGQLLMRYVEEAIGAANKYRASKCSLNGLKNPSL
jgi:hypothetical protein